MTMPQAHSSRVWPLGLLAVLAISTHGCGGSPAGPASPSPPTVQVRNVTASADGSSGCPATIRFSANAATVGTGRVGYRWELWDGTQGTTQYLTVSSDGPKTGFIMRLEPYYVTVEASGTYTARIHILTPVDWVPVPASFTVTCSG